MADDIFSALLSSGLGGGNMAQATAASPFYQGEVSHAGPMGQISQALMPLMQGATGGGHQEQILSHLTDIIKLANAIDDRKLKQLEADAAAHPERGEAQLVALVKHLRAEGGGQLPEGLKVSKKVGDTTISMGGSASAGKTLEERAAAGEPLAVKGLELRQNAADAANQRVTTRAQVLAGEAEQRRIDKEQRQQQDDYRKKIEGGQASAIDPVTFRKVPTASLEDDRSGKIKTLPKNDALIATQIEEGMRQLYELKSVVPKVLPRDTPNSFMGLFVTPAHAAGVKAQIARRDPDAVAFDRLRSLSKYPVIQIINKNPMRFPLAEMRDVQERGGIQDSDTQQSANVLIDQALKNLRYTAQVLGLDATELENSITAEYGPQDKTSKLPNPSNGTKQPKGKVPPAEEVARQIKQMRELGYSRDRINTTLQGIYGGDVDVR